MQVDGKKRTLEQAAGSQSSQTQPSSRGAKSHFPPPASTSERNNRKDLNNGITTYLQMMIAPRRNLEPRLLQVIGIRQLHQRLTNCSTHRDILPCL